MAEEKSPRDLMHDLGNTLQEKVALQFLLVQAADRIEQLAGQVPDDDERQDALEAAERYRRLAEL
jgi:hypothetical protein